MDITQLLAFVMQNDASDLHLSGGNPPIVRVYGSLKRLKSDVLTNETIRAMLYSIMTDEQRSDYEKDMELDFAISFGEKARFRVNAFTNRQGSAAVFRTIPSVVPTMEELDLPAVIRRFSDLEKGIVLVTGPTGSGKSTTLASMINHINETQPKHILTIEDPVEFFHTSKKSLVNHRELGNDTHSFARALKSSLREDPDVILVGEMRDHETISLALTAAETGHLVFGTLHSSSAAKTVDRIIDVFPTGDKEMIRAMLASSLQGVVAQTLLKKVGGKGRVAAFEILVGTNAVRNLIRENQIPQMYSMIQTGSRYGMITMEDSVHDLLERGIIDEDEARVVLAKSTDEDGADRDPAVSAATNAKSKMTSGADPHGAEAGDSGYSF
ncbi:MAG: type IV pili twitching motility protein PilT [Alphaproteobacteria bacterium RIFCSPHIGHO2_12_FULL_45_9]|nr:MAG: type IV pili twitching motility protein PilT [Alphaproteobacteria bacterium RIFCSPHIGHO2_02_FULL_46_13]OFW96465.1 MAG: type IV pili twitching motility protein PilT [Alphaproteobacteria bacterium RIFCSPHIGHO2_12_FULL_45_9]